MEPLDDLWSGEHGKPIFSAVMSKERFKSLLRFIRFDNKATREQRRLQDKLAAFKDVWEMFNAKLCSLFIPGADITVDEQLVAFRGKCPFRQYIPSKPAKYGIKVWWACDAQTCFPLQGQVYLGRQPGTEKDVTKHWLKSGRNIVMDNFFTSVPLAEELLSLHTTVVRTIRKNKPDIPKLMTETKNRPENSTIFGFCGPLTLASYVPRKNKLVTVLSTMHHDEEVGGEKLKPAIILHYNANKSGVDNMDKLAITFTCRRKCNCWPLALFFNLIDVTGIAAMTIWLYSTSDATIKRNRIRRSFLLKLGRQLTENYIEERLQNKASIQKSAKTSLKTLGYLNVEETTREMEPSVKRRCVVCPRNKDRKVKQIDR